MKYYGNKWGIDRKTFKLLCTLHNKTFNLPFRYDDPDKCRYGPDYWQTYPVKDYDYRFNSWGYRGEDYQQYQGQPVNICVGDSCTVNLGGPVSHSWPFLLSHYFEIPTLNCGIDGLSFYDFGMLIDKVKSFFEVKRIFVLYNLFVEDWEPIDNTAFSLRNVNIDTKLDTLKKYAWIHDAYWQFDPPWTFFNKELPCLYEHFPDAHNYLRTVKFNFQMLDICQLLAHTWLKVEYQKISGGSWIPYEKFCESVVADVNVVDRFSTKMDILLIETFLSQKFVPVAKKMLLTNRDGFHMSKLVNQNLADYFYQQTTTGLENRVL